jgi:hypothetical protein
MEMCLSGERKTFTFDGEGRLVLGDRAAKVVTVSGGGVYRRWFQARPIILHLGYTPTSVTNALHKLPAEHRKTLGELLGDFAPQDHNERIATYISEEGMYELAARRRKGGAADTLYVMQYSYRRDILKVGRSDNPEKRRRQLEGSHAFHVEILAMFPGQGELEGQVHEALAAHRNEEGAGREWFAVSATQAIMAITSLMASAAREKRRARQPPK